MRSPNILLIMSDQHRADVMGCAGDPIVRTPHMDKLAAEGIRFDNVYCQGPLCMPARASFLTERYVRDHGVSENNFDTPTSLPTFVGDLRAAGYHTSCIGKMHLWVHGGTDPERKLTSDTRQRAGQLNAYGFAEPIETAGKLATVLIGSEYTDYLQDRGLLGTYQQWVADRSYSTNEKIQGKRKTLPLWSTGSNPVSGDAYIDAWHGTRTVQWIEEYDRDQPWLQWVGFPGPHDPWDAPADYVDLYRSAEMPTPASLERPKLPGEGAFHEFLNYFLNVHSDSPNLTDAVIAEVRRYYYGNVTVIDEAIGRMMAALERRGLLENTWVIYTSDHGEMMGEHRMLAKMVFYEQAVKVPLIIRPPGGCDPRLVSEMIGHFDLSATIRDIAQSAGDPAFEGRSLLGWMDGGTGFSRPAIFSENYGVAMVRTPSHKLVFVQDTLEPAQLFDLAADPREDSNIIGQPDQTQVTDDLMGTYATPFMAPGRVKPGPGVLDPLTGPAKNPARSRPTPT